MYSKWNQKNSLYIQLEYNAVISTINPWVQFFSIIYTFNEEKLVIVHYGYQYTYYYTVSRYIWTVVAYLEFSINQCHTVIPQ
jgi:hypothetical protein